jgi:hypothetical protein
MTIKLRTISRAFRQPIDAANQDWFQASEFIVVSLAQATRTLSIRAKDATKRHHETRYQKAPSRQTSENP